MPYGPFEGETLLDLSVNAVPLAMLALFLVPLLFTGIWDPNPFAVVVTVVLHLVPIVSLALVTWVAGVVIQRDERAAGGRREA